MSNDTRTWRDVLPPIFADCVGTDLSRYSIDHPFAEGGHVYATDGRIVVRAPLSMADGIAIPTNKNTETSPSTYPPAAGLFPGGEFEADPLPLVTIPSAGPDVKCRSCDGTGKWECDKCDGDGVIECDCGYEHPCPDCDGRDNDRCEDCEGVGTVKPRPRPIDFGSVVLNERYVRVIQRANGRIYANQRGPKAAVRFAIFGAIEGMLMPMSLPEGYGAKSEDSPVLIAADLVTTS